MLINNRLLKIENKDRGIANQINQICRYILCVAPSATTPVTVFLFKEKQKVSGIVSFPAMLLCGVC